MKDWKERLNQKFLFTQDKDFTWTAVPGGRCITGLTKTEDLIHFIEQRISERDKEWIQELDLLKGRIEYNQHDMGEIGKFCRIGYINNFIADSINKLTNYGTR